MKIPIFKSTNEAILFGLENRDKQTIFKLLARKIRTKVLTDKLRKKNKFDTGMRVALQHQLCDECLRAITGQITKREYQLIFPGVEFIVK